MRLRVCKVDILERVHLLGSMNVLREFPRHHPMDRTVCYTCKSLIVRMDQMTMCNVKGVVQSDTPTENYP